MDHGLFIAVDGPNGVGKTSLIVNLKTRLLSLGYNVTTTSEPTRTELGTFTREFAENYSGLSLACLVAADRYEHLNTTIIPALKQGNIVISDRYLLSSLILQAMDGVDNSYIMELNSKVIMPDVQLALYADVDTLQKRLAARDGLTRFEKGNQSANEIRYMNKGVAELEKKGVKVLKVNTNKDMDTNIDVIVSNIFNK